MPDNTNLPAQPKPEAAPGEFDFAQSGTTAPRLKRRSLKTQTPTVLKPLAKSAVPEASKESTGPATPTSRPRLASTTNPTTSPHGTRPATLYYSSTPRQKEEPLPMKSTPTASSTPVSSPAPQPARSGSSPIRPASVVDYRTNVERQAREQKSVGNILSYLVYTLLGLFVISALLAGYGAYTVSKQLRQQSVTVDQLDARLSSQNQALADQLKTTMTTLNDAQARIGRQQDLILKQQESIAKLLAATQDNASAIRQERQARAGETSTLRARLKDLEYRGPSTQKY